MKVYANEYKFLGIIPLGGKRIAAQVKGSELQVYEKYHGLSFVLNELGKYFKNVREFNKEIGLESIFFPTADQKRLNKLGVKFERFSYSP